LPSRTREHAALVAVRCARNSARQASEFSGVQRHVVPAVQQLAVVAAGRYASVTIRRNR